MLLALSSFAAAGSAIGDECSGRFKVLLGSDGPGIAPGDPIDRVVEILGPAPQTRASGPDVPFKVTLYRYPGIFFEVASERVMRVVFEDVAYRLSDGLSVGHEYADVIERLSRHNVPVGDYDEQQNLLVVQVPAEAEENRQLLYDPKGNRLSSSVSLEDAEDRSYSYIPKRPHHDGEILEAPCADMSVPFAVIPSPGVFPLPAPAMPMLPALAL